MAVVVPIAGVRSSSRRRKVCGSRSGRRAPAGWIDGTKKLGMDPERFRVGGGGGHEMDGTNPLGFRVRLDLVGGGLLI